MPCAVLLLLLLDIHRVLTHPDDVNALLEIKRHLDDPLNVLSNWTVSKTSTICSNWYGIHCNRRHRVNKIMLQNQQLQGSLPSVFQLLGFLEEIHLEHNKLSGNIPYLLENAHLKVIEMNNNKLEGPFPFVKPLHWTSPLSKSLKRLSLDNNLISGSIGGGPASYFRHSVLEYLNVRNNNLTGPLPKGFEGLYCLLYLDFGCNVYLEGPIPKQWMYFPHLHTLILKNNQHICGGLEYTIYVHKLNIENSGLENDCAYWNSTNMLPCYQTPSPSLPSPSPSLPSPSPNLPSPSPSLPSPLPSHPSPSPSLPSPSPSPPPPKNDKPKIPIVPIIPIIPILPRDDDDDGEGDSSVDGSPRIDLTEETPSISPENEEAPVVPVSTVPPSASPSPSELSPPISPSPNMPNSPPVPLPPSLNDTTKVILRSNNATEEKKPLLVRVQDIEGKVVVPLAAGALLVVAVSGIAYFFLPSASSPLSSSPE